MAITHDIIDQLQVTLDTPKHVQTSSHEYHPGRSSQPAWEPHLLQS